MTWHQALNDNRIAIVDADLRKTRAPLTEGSLEVRRDTQVGVNPEAIQIVSPRQCQNRNRLVGPGDPSGAAIECRGHVSEAPVNDQRAASRSLREHLHGYLEIVCFISLVGSFARIAGEARQSLRSADRLNVLI